MRVERLELIDFRNHEPLTVELPAGVSVLAGANGVGKTNLLEAIGYLATLGSHRVGQDASLVRVDPDPAKLGQLLRERLLADRPREIERGITLSGPHRDDLALTLRALPARTHASQGEAWSLALALRLAAHRLLTDEGEEPVLLLDDVFAELDRRRRGQVAEVARAAEQALVTAAVTEELPAGVSGG